MDHGWHVIKHIYSSFPHQAETLVDVVSLVGFMYVYPTVGVVVVIPTCCHLIIKSTSLSVWVYKITLPKHLYAERKY